AAVLPQGDALILMLLRYPQELVDPAEHKLPEGSASDYRVSARELQMAEQLIDSMSGKWTPDDYRDEFRERLQAIIRRRIRTAGGTTKVDDEPDATEENNNNVVDFMSLLEQSLKAKKRTPSKKASPAKKAPAKKAARKSTAKKATKKAPAKRKAG